MTTLAEAIALKGKTMQTVTTYAQQSLDEHWQDVWHLWRLLGTAVRKPGLLRTIVSVCWQGNRTRADNQNAFLCEHAMRTHGLKEKLILCLIV